MTSFKMAETIVWQLGLLKLYKHSSPLQINDTHKQSQRVNIHSHYTARYLLGTLYTWTLQKESYQNSFHSFWIKFTRASLFPCTYILNTFTGKVKTEMAGEVRRSNAYVTSSYCAAYFNDQTWIQDLWNRDHWATNALHTTDLIVHNLDNKLPMCKFGDVYLRGPSVSLKNSMVLNVQFTPIDMLTIRVLMWFGTSQFYPHTSGLLWDIYTIYPVPCTIWGRKQYCKQNKGQ